jgi:hypothetical protein
MIQDRTITVSYHPTVDEVLRSHRIHTRISTKWWQWLGVIVLGIVMLVFLILQIRIAALPTWYVILIVILAFAVLYPGLFYFRRWQMRRAVARNLERMTDGDKVVHYIIDADAVRSRVENLSEGSEKWAIFARVVRTPEGFLLYPTEHTYYWLPNHAFEPPEDADALADMARRYAPRYVDLTR